MNVLGLIPARAGSKSIPRKNIATLAGRPLLAYTCEAALASERLTRVVLSTDDPEIAQVGRDFGVTVPFLRPADLARDDTPSLDVAQHAVQWLAENDGFNTDVLVLLQPTSPLRRACHIDQALDRMEETGADTVVSVVELPHRFSPYSVMELQDGRLQDFWRSPVPFDRYRRQEAPLLYARNGPAVLATRTHVLMGLSSFYGSHTVPFVMDQLDSVDIDDSFDLALASWLLQRQSENLT